MLGARAQLRAHLRKRLVLVVLGTRPEAIKLAPVVKALRKMGIGCRLASTGQHRQLAGRIVRELGLKADDDLALMRPNQSPAEFAARAVPSLAALIRRARPPLVIVQGDTTTAFSGALAAFQEAVPIAHVEAGLRTGDLTQPFPEEANRIIIDELSSLKFAPTLQAARNLRREDRGGVFVTGNTAVDALAWALSGPRPIRDRRLRRILAASRVDEPLILVTMHRRESLGGGIEAVAGALSRILEARPKARVIWPLHLNPQVRAQVRRGLRHPRARLLAPLDYFDMLAALQRCRFVMTDSGGLQEEAVTLGKPTLVLREVTDRPEAVRTGTAAVVGCDPAAIVPAALPLLEDSPLYRRMAKPTMVFGDGRAGERIARHIGAYLKKRSWS